MSRHHSPSAVNAPKFEPQTMYTGGFDVTNPAPANCMARNTSTLMARMAIVTGANRFRRSSRSSNWIASGSCGRKSAVRAVGSSSASRAASAASASWKVTAWVLPDASRCSSRIARPSVSTLTMRSRSSVRVCVKNGPPNSVSRRPVILTVALPTSTRPAPTRRRSFRDGSSHDSGPRSSPKRTAALNERRGVSARSATRTPLDTVSVTS